MYKDKLPVAEFLKVVKKAVVSAEISLYIILQQHAMPHMLSSLVGLLLYNTLQHALPERLQTAEAVRGSFGILHDAELEGTLHEDLGVLPPGEETGTHAGVEGVQTNDVHL